MAGSLTSPGLKNIDAALVSMPRVSVEARRLHPAWYGRQLAAGPDLTLPLLLPSNRITINVSITAGQLMSLQLALAVLILLSQILIDCQ